ncbi:MAG: LPXTG cell wall anchor domain-containing protein [Candidatus Nanopelagicales bacterium]|nr:LPXTG cell wall anchor domain-containing protein [Candidatus Nanopelagicales bacterium]
MNTTVDPQGDSGAADYAVDGPGRADSTGAIAESITIRAPGVYDIRMTGNRFYRLNGVAYTAPRSGTGSATTFSAVSYQPAAMTAKTHSVTYSTTVTVVSSSNDLAKTGADNNLTIAAIGGGLILVGGGAVYATRRRRERTAR